MKCMTLVCSPLLLPKAVSQLVESDIGLVEHRTER
jgi:hypothetical protein